MSWISALIIGLAVGIPMAIRTYNKYKEREENNQCIHCGAPYDENSTYCPSCGRNLARERKIYRPAVKNSNVKNKPTKFCSKCGNSVDMTDSFCSECGHRL